METHCSLIVFEAIPQKRTHAWHCKLGQKPLPQEVRNPRGELLFFFFFLLHRHVVKLSSKCLGLCPCHVLLSTFIQKSLLWGNFNAEVHSWFKYLWALIIINLHIYINAFRILTQGSGNIMRGGAEEIQDSDLWEELCETIYSLHDIIFSSWIHCIWDYLHKIGSVIMSGRWVYEASPL